MTTNPVKFRKKPMKLFKVDFLLIQASWYNNLMHSKLETFTACSCIKTLPFSYLFIMLSLFQSYWYTNQVFQ